MGLTGGQLQGFLSALKGVAGKYGMRLNQTKTEILTHPQRDTPSIRFENGETVPTTPHVRYLGAMVSWKSSFETAFYHRLGIAEEAFKKLRLVWNSNMPRRKKIFIFHTTFRPSLMYGLDTLTLTQRQLHRIDAQFIRFLRRVIGIKASYYSRISNEEVLYQAYRPTLPSALLEYQRYKYAVISYQSDRPDPTHNVIFGPAHKDLIRVKGRRRGMQFPYWLEATSKW